MTSKNIGRVAPWICAQIGGREHYAIPRALHASGALKLFMTDFWADTGTRLLSRVFSGKMTRSLATRRHSELISAPVKAWNLQALAWEAQLRWMAHNSGVSGRYRGFCQVGKHFTHAMVRHLRSNSCMPENGVFFGYDTESLEVMEYLKQRGFACVLDQIDPGQVEAEIVQAEQRLWPGWEAQSLDIPEDFFERYHQEWAVADRVVVNSEWSRQALVQQGVPPEKLAVIPLCYEAEFEMLKLENGNNKATISNSGLQFSASSPLRVLFLGQVILRKGIQYLMAAARMLQHAPVRFDIVGPIHISKIAVSSSPPNVVFHGRATRDKINDWYRNAHLFVLPTLSDGFAITQIEAMSNGLPVIATPNCGAVVSDGMDGLLVPPRDPEALARAICSYLENPELLENHHRAALQKSKQFSLDRIGAALLALGREIHRFPMQ